MTTKVVKEKEISFVDEYDILVFDPGVTTGYGVFNLQIADSFVDSQLNVIDAGSIKWENRLPIVTQLIAEHKKVRKILVEDFTFRPDLQTEAFERWRQTQDISFYNNVKKTYRALGAIENAIYAQYGSSFKRVFVYAVDQNKKNIKIPKGMGKILGSSHAKSCFRHGQNYMNKQVKPAKPTKKSWQR